MELNREQIIKALECCTLEGCHDCRECPQGNVLLSLCKKNAMADALSLIKELTEENERLRADNLYGLSASKLAKKVEELSRENEWLSNRVVCKVVIPEEKLEEIKSECLERVELDIKAIEADTMRKMLTMIKERLVQLLMDSSYLDVLDEEHWIPAADQLFDEIDQIAKEMLEG